MPLLRLLGTAQDAGLPQAGCALDCCRAARRRPALRRRAACLALVAGRKRWLIDATPDFREQLAALDARHPGTLEGIFLTHGHAGHYTGLVHLGREAMAANGVPVWGMPRMRAFLRKNAPWEQLVRLGHIALRPLAGARPVRPAPGIRITPLPVPHRAEYTETVAFRIEGPRRTALWLPDIDRWEPWNVPLERAIESVDVAWIDGTFFSGVELPGRDISVVPHPTIASTLARLAALPARQRRKVRFIHLNHTNPAARAGTPERRAVERAGMAVAREGETVTI